MAVRQMRQGRETRAAKAQTGEIRAAGLEPGAGKGLETAGLEPDTGKYMAVESGPECRLRLEKISYRYGDGRGVQEVSLALARGEFVGLIGPNGSGKSTLLKMVYRALQPDSGQIWLDGRRLDSFSYRESAQRMAVVGQEHDLDFHFSVEEIVAMGRSPYKRLFEPDHERDRYMVRHALEHLGMQDMAKRDYFTLSGGEKQRVLLARAVAQESDLLILDEPTNHLDVRYQIQMFDFIRRLKVSVLAAIHDLNMAALYCDRLCLFCEGRMVCSGTPGAVLTAENLERFFKVRCIVRTDEANGRPLISYLPGQTGHLPF